MKKHLSKLFSALLILVLMLPAFPAQVSQAAGTISLTSLGSAYTQDFDTLANTGTSSTVPTGWDFSESGTNANTIYTAGTGSATAGDTYSFGSTSSTERAFGGLLSGSLNPTIGAQFTNNTGSTITSLAISYTGEMWRAGVTSRNAADRIDFQLSTNATSLTTGTWADYDSLDFNSPNINTTVGLLDGNLAGNRTALSFTITGVSITNGSSFWIRWTDFNISSSDDGLSVDDFSLTPSQVDVAPTVTGTDPADTAIGVAVNTNVTVNFSESVDVAAGAINVECPAGTSVATNAQADDVTSVVIDPASDLPFSIACVINVTAGSVTDNDGIAETLTGTTSFVFTTAGPVDDAPNIVSTTPTDGATNSLVSGNISVNFSEGVDVAAGAITVECPAGNVVASNALADNVTSLVIDPAGNLPFNTACVISVDALGVTDEDSNDPPDTLTGATSFGFTTEAAPPPAGSVVVSQVYGGGGNSGATFKNDFIELYNRTGSTISLSGWSVQYAAAAGTSWQVTPLSGSIAPGKYYLVQEAQGAGGTLNLPAPDAIGTIPMSATSGKVALVNNSTALTGACPTGSNISDFVGYGTANCFEGGGAAPTLSNTTAALRLNGGAQDTDNNNVDFVAAAPNPRSGTPTVFSTTPSNGSFGALLDANITINFSEPVDVTGSWFTISCATSGGHTAALSGGPTSYTLNPDFDFVYNELCTVTVIASQVTDHDINDPPDNMVANYVFSFTTIELLVCGDPATPIHDIQGSGTTSPLIGTPNVVIEGVVVGDYQNTTTEFSGFHIQEEDADVDADPATSEGIFVFDNGFGVDVLPGDVVRVKGTVSEFFNLTELSSVSVVQVCSSGNSVTTTTISLPVADLNDWERYEGMMINIPDELTVTETFTLARFGEVALSVNGRLLNPTMITTPGAAAIAQQSLNNRSRILLDDGNNQQNIDPTIHPVSGLSEANTLRSGYTVNGLTGVLEQRFGVYRVQPVGLVNFNADNPRPASPDPVGGRLRVAAMNVLNYFTTLNQPGNVCGPSNLECRGANSASEFTRQRDKILTAMLGLDADVIGLMELENNATAAIQDLVDGLNAATAPGTYAFINTGTIGTDAIKVGLIYRTTKVTPVGAYAILNSSVDPTFIDTLNRPVLAQTFEENLTGERFTVVVNHLKSKGSACAGDPDTGDGQGNCNITRTNAAIAEANWLAGDPTDSGDPDFVLIGDFNSYAKEDPITALLNAGYTDLIDQFGGADVYSYVFGGQSGYLDHGLGTSTLTGQVTGATEWHINADEPIALDYNEEFKTPNQVNTFYAPNAYRSSDHDPLVIGLNLVPQCNGQNATVYVDHNGKIVGGPLNGQNYNGLLSGTTGNDVIVGTESADTILALGGNDVVCSLGGSDTIFGGAGNDTINSGAGNDTIFGNTDNDVIEAGDGNDVAFGESGNDTINGGNDKDTIFGGDGIDVLDGGADKDVVDGGLGVDTLAGGSENDTVLGGPGNDSLDGGAGNDVCSGGLGTDSSFACEINISIP